MSVPAWEKLNYVVRHFTWVMGHPLNRDRPLRTIGRYLGWHLGSRLVGRHAIAVPYVNDLRMLVAAGGNAVGTVHFGLDEFTEQVFCAHLLRPGDLFVDVGANDGSYCLLASGVAGAHTIAFEPEPSTLRQLRDNLALNQLESRVDIRAVAAGAQAGTVRMVTDLRTANHVVTADRPATGEATIEVRCARLDDELAGQSPVMIKIDVEGFEPDVLAGAAATLAQPSLLAVQLEDMAMGRHERPQHQLMLAAGFRSYRYEPAQRRLIDLQGKANPGQLNTLYLREPEMVAARLAQAAAIRVRGHRI